jgi:hypothetical protein
MNEIELLAELIEDLYRDLQPEIQPLSAEDLAWQPHPEANSIGVTVWHIARGLDFLATRVLLGKPAEAELWHVHGWREKTSYDPRGIGYGGWGVLTGYTWAEALAVPPLNGDELTAYLAETCALAAGQVRRLTPESAHHPAEAVLGGRLTYYRWIKEFYKGFQAHVGEIVAIKEIIKRKARNEEQAGQSSPA